MVFYQLCLLEARRWLPMSPLRDSRIYGRGGGTRLDQNPCDLCQSFHCPSAQSRERRSTTPSPPFPEGFSLTEQAVNWRWNEFESVDPVCRQRLRVGSSSPAKAIGCEGKVLRLERPRWDRAGSRPGKARGGWRAPSAGIKDFGRWGALFTPQDDFFCPAQLRNPSREPRCAVEACGGSTVAGRRAESFEIASPPSY